MLVFTYRVFVLRILIFLRILIQYTKNIEFKILRVSIIRTFNKRDYTRVCAIENVVNAIACLKHRQTPLGLRRIGTVRPNARRSSKARLHVRAPAPKHIHTQYAHTNELWTHTNEHRKRHTSSAVPFAPLVVEFVSGPLDHSVLTVAVTARAWVFAQFARSQLAVSVAQLGHTLD